MAKQHYNNKTSIKNGTSFREFDSAEVANHISSEVIENGDLKLIKTPKIAFKIQLSTYNRSSIDVDRCKTLDKDDVTYPSDGIIRILADRFASEKSIIVWLDAEGAPIFVATSNEIVLEDATLYDDADDLTEEFLVEFISSSDFKMKEWFLVSSDFQVWYIRDKLGISKLFIPFMEHWFDRNWPGMIVSKDHEDGQKISKLGLRTVLQIYMLSIGANINTTSETFPSEAEFTLAIPILTESSLSGGLLLEDKQLMQLSHMLPKSEAVGHKNKTAFDETVITNPKAISVAFDEHKNVTWGVFTTAMEMFPVGCTIFFSPNQVILDAEDRLVFSTAEVRMIIYHGPDFLLDEKQNTVDVVCNGESIDNNLRAKLIEYFDGEFDLSLSVIRLATNNANQQELLI